LRRTLIIFAAVVALLLLGTGAVYGYDTSRSDRIAEGVSVGGVPVGGMRTNEARVKLRAAILDPLREPLVLRHRGRRFTLTASKAAVVVDVDGSVDRALAVSRDGGMFKRTWRQLAGGDVQEDVAVDVSYSEAAVDRLIARVEDKLERPARDAAVDLEQGQVEPIPARTGLRVQTRRLEREIVARLTSPRQERSVRIRTSVVKPKVTDDKLADKYPAILIVDRASFTLTFYKDLQKAKTYGVAVGQAGLETPAGLYSIQNKAVNPAWHVPDSDWAGDLAGTVIPGDDPSNPIKARWLGVYDGVGVHGTDAAGSIGTAASHGCIRMRIPEVIELYDQVPVGAPIYIA
jgi:lipoprotein-anchoring transpeptidase ErfK/SrfK